MGEETLSAWLRNSLLSRGEKIAISYLRDGKPESAISFLGLDRDANRCARAFQAQGVKKGDRVVLFMDKSLVFVVAHLALLKIGAISVPLNPGFKRSEMEYLLKDAEPALTICDPDKAGMLAAIGAGGILLPIDTRAPFQKDPFFRSAADDPIEADIQPQDPALVIYTSGTTGNPKGAVLTHQNLVCDAKNIIDIWEISNRDVLCHVLPLFHVHGLCFALHTALLAGSGVVMLDQFSPQTILSVLAGESPAGAPTVFMAVPAMYTKLMDSAVANPRRFDSVRLWTSGSAPLLVSEFERIKTVFGKEPVEREGMSETGMNFSNPVRGHRKPGSIGLPLPGLEVRIVDPNTLVDVPGGEVGEIWLKSPAITPGYWRKPEETADTFMDGWFRTGDLGKVDQEGYYYLTDRMKHIIITGGENVSAKEVETVINLVDGVLESSVVGAPDQKWGERVVAAVVKSPDREVTAEQIKSFCKEHLHDWKCPKEILFVGEMPKNTMGKVLKEELKKKFSH